MPTGGNAREKPRLLIARASLPPIEAMARPIPTSCSSSRSTPLLRPRWSARVHRALRASTPTMALAIYAGSSLTVAAGSGSLASRTVRGIYFRIDRRFKFNPVIIEKGGRRGHPTPPSCGESSRTGRHAEALAHALHPRTGRALQPAIQALLEIQSRRDLETTLEKIYANSVLSGDDGPDGWGIKYDAPGRLQYDQ